MYKMVICKCISFRCSARKNIDVFPEFLLIMSLLLAHRFICFLQVKKLFRKRTTKHTDRRYKRRLMWHKLQKKVKLQFAVEIRPSLAWTWTTQLLGSVGLQVAYIFLQCFMIARLGICTLFYRLVSRALSLIIFDRIICIQIDVHAWYELITLWLA